MNLTVAWSLHKILEAFAVFWQLCEPKVLSFMAERKKDNWKIFLAVSNSRILSDTLLAPVWYPSIDVIGRCLKSGISVPAVGGAAPLRAGRHHRTGGAARADCCRCRLGRVHVGLLLRLHDVLLVADPLVAKPVTNLGSAAAIWIYCIMNDYTYFTCDTVMPHFLANSSLTSSEG